MAEITLKDIKHTYDPNPGPGSEYALKDLSITWSDGGAYALLGPSGCGKTTLLNIISGLVRPSHGQIFFDDQNITNLAPDARNIAQVFQFPVIYDTMTVYENLAFPLKNRGVEPSAIDAKVREIAGMLELEDRLNTRASGLTADSKQKISLGRGLVRSDVNVIMFCVKPFGAYANGFTDITQSFVQVGATVQELSARTDLTPHAYAEFAEDWAKMGATIIGGCCEVGPAHIAEIVHRLT